MKKIYVTLIALLTVGSLSASNRYVSPLGSDGDGKSWANAVHTIAQAIWNVGAGDTMFIAEGVYNESISAQSGATYLGGYNAETGERDPELYESCIDGTGLTSWLLVKYDAAPENNILVDGLIFQNANHATWGAAGIFLRGNMTINNCVFRNLTSSSNAGAIFVEKVDDIPAVISNCLFENCTATDGTNGTGAIRNSGNAIIENCIVRNCVGGIGGIRNDAGIVRNCVLYNNHSDYNGCLYGGGTFINNTICNNTGTRYAGCRVTGKMVNNVFWGNTTTYEHINYVASGAGSSNNVGDVGEGITLGLAADNIDPAGPNFRNPTGFGGRPRTEAEKIAVTKADFSLTDASTALLDAGEATQAPATDLAGVTRPKGSGVDIGAYEYDPNAVVISVTGVTLLQDTLKVVLGRTGTLVAQVEPVDANNKRLNWSIDDPTVASIRNGKITALREDTTIARVETQDGGYTASAVVVVLPVPPVKYPHEVVEADALYHIEDYTIPSFIPFLVAKEEARIDSLGEDVDLTVIPAKVAVMQERIAALVSKEHPYNQIATFNGDPATHMGFCWFTNGDITDGVVQLLPMEQATEADFNNEPDQVITLQAVNTHAQLHYTPIQASESPKYDICTAAGLPRNTKFDYISHKAQATNLTPGTTYSWRVGYGEYWSEVAQFVTKDANQGGFSFVYMTDSHIQDAEYIREARQCAETVAKNESDVKFCVFPGDFVDTGGDTNSEWQWEQWFEGSMRPMLNKMAVVPTDGNHDDSRNLNYDYHFNTDWSFANAADTKPQFQGITYSFVYGDVLFLVFSMQDWWRARGSSEASMQSTYLSNDVKHWFQEQIAAHPNTKYRVTLSHKNVFSGAGHHLDDESALIRAMMLPIFKECRIDLAIQGHDHCYEVIGPVNPDTRMLVEGAVSDVQTVAINTSTNMTGKSGGTFVTDSGTLYFIGATCGRKRYYPYTRQRLEEEYTTDPALLFDYHHHNVENLFDLFTSMFGQPGSPSYSRFNVSDQGIEIKSYKTDANHNSTLYNTIMVKRTGRHGQLTGYEEVEQGLQEGDKFVRDGQLYIYKDGRIYNALGLSVR